MDARREKKVVITKQWKICWDVNQVEAKDTLFMQTTVTELQIRDFGFLCNHFVLYSYDLSQFEYFYYGTEVPMPSLESQNLSEFSLV